LGAIGGILIVDYFLLRRTRLDLAGLYRRQGPYWYENGFNTRAIIAFCLGVAPCIPGFLGAVKWINVPPVWSQLYSYAWFISLGIAGLAYALMMMSTRRNDV
jgi:NCS1 family nucleobase:cation symporter-1